MNSAGCPASEGTSGVAEFPLGPWQAKQVCAFASPGNVSARAAAGGSSSNAAAAAHRTRVLPGLEAEDRDLGIAFRRQGEHEGVGAGDDRPPLMATRHIANDAAAGRAVELGLPQD